MARPLLMVLLVCSLVVFVPMALAESPTSNLIPARPQYLEATHVPSGNVNKSQFNPPAPTPSEQLYVFWFLGKVISYPVDRVEAYVSKLREEWSAKPVPAAAPVQPNPFEAQRLGQIPPAPPIMLGRGDR